MYGNSNQNVFGQQTGGSLFGNKSFGSTNQGGLFNQSNTNTQSHFGSGFNTGMNSSGSGFGSGSLFGNKTENQTGGGFNSWGTFGGLKNQNQPSQPQFNTTNSGFGGSTFNQTNSFFNKTGTTTNSNGLGFGSNTQQKSFLGFGTKFTPFFHEKVNYHNICANQPDTIQEEVRWKGMRESTQFPTTAISSGIGIQPNQSTTNNPFNPFPQVSPTHNTFNPASGAGFLGQTGINIDKKNIPNTGFTTGTSHTGFFSSINTNTEPFNPLINNSTPGFTGQSNTTSSIPGTLLNPLTNNSITTNPFSSLTTPNTTGQTSSLNPGGLFKSAFTSPTNTIGTSGSLFNTQNTAFKPTLPTFGSGLLGMDSSQQQNTTDIKQLFPISNPSTQGLGTTTNLISNINSINPFQSTVGYNTTHTSLIGSLTNLNPIKPNDINTTKDIYGLNNIQNNTEIFLTTENSAKTVLDIPFKPSNLHTLISGGSMLLKSQPSRLSRHKKYQPQGKYINRSRASNYTYNDTFAINESIVKMNIIAPPTHTQGSIVNGILGSVVNNNFNNKHLSWLHPHTHEDESITTKNNQLLTNFKSNILENSDFSLSESTHKTNNYLDIQNINDNHTSDLHTHLSSSGNSNLGARIFPQNGTHTDHTDMNDEHKGKPNKDKHDGGKTHKEGIDNSDDKYYLEFLYPKLTKMDYFTTPSMATIKGMTEAELSRVPDFTIKREAFGEILWPGYSDLRQLNLDDITTIEKLGVSVYAGDTPPPSVGIGLNKKAIVLLKDCKPNKLATLNESEINNFVKKIERFTCKMGACFISLDPKTWEWKFQVEHFSKYGLPSDWDEDDKEEEEEEEIKNGKDKEGVEEVNPNLIINKDIRPILSFDPSQSYIHRGMSPSASSTQYYLTQSLFTPSYKMDTHTSYTPSFMKPSEIKAPFLGTYEEVVENNFQKSNESFFNDNKSYFTPSLKVSSPLQTSTHMNYMDKRTLPNQDITPFNLDKPSEIDRSTEFEHTLPRSTFNETNPNSSFLTSNLSNSTTPSYHKNDNYTHTQFPSFNGPQLGRLSISSNGIMAYPFTQPSTSVNRQSNECVQLMKISPSSGGIHWHSGEWKDESLTPTEWVDTVKNHIKWNSEEINEEELNKYQEKQVKEIVDKTTGKQFFLTPSKVNQSHLSLFRTIPVESLHIILKGFADILKGVNINKPSQEDLEKLINYQFQCAQNNIHTYNGDVSQGFFHLSQSISLDVYYLSPIAYELWELISALFIMPNHTHPANNKDYIKYPTDTPYKDNNSYTHSHNPYKEADSSTHSFNPTKDNQIAHTTTKTSQPAQLLSKVYTRISDWLRCVNSRKVYQFLTQLPPSRFTNTSTQELLFQDIFHLLTANKVTEAVECLVNIPTHQQDTNTQSSPVHIQFIFLMMLCANHEIDHNHFEKQLAHFDELNITHKIHTHIRVIYQLLAGRPDDLPTRFTLDWKTTFALYFWYPPTHIDLHTELLQPPQCTDGDRRLLRAISQYQEGFTKAYQTSILPPIPNYITNKRCTPIHNTTDTHSQNNMDTSNTHLTAHHNTHTHTPRYDIQYNILKTYSGLIPFNFENFDVYTHTPFGLDSSLTWPISVTLYLALRLGHFGPTQHVHTHLLRQLLRLNLLFSTQLESMGLWGWSCFIHLFYTENIYYTQQSIRNILLRNVCVDEQSNSNKYIIESLGIPVAWWDEAIALKMNKEGRYLEAAYYFHSAYKSVVYTQLNPTHNEHTWYHHNIVCKMDNIRTMDDKLMVEYLVATAQNLNHFLPSFLLNIIHREFEDTPTHTNDEDQHENIISFETKCDEILDIIQSCESKLPYTHSTIETLGLFKNSLIFLLFKQQNKKVTHTESNEKNILQSYYPDEYLHTHTPYNSEDLIKIINKISSNLNKNTHTHTHPSLTIFLSEMKSHLHTVATI